MKMLKNLSCGTAAICLLWSTSSLAVETAAHPTQPVSQQTVEEAQEQQPGQVCREITPTGSNINHTVCFTREEWDAQPETAREDVDFMTSSGTATGG